MLLECIEIASSLPKAEGYLALANFRLSQVEQVQKQQGRADKYLQKAIAARRAVIDRRGAHPSDKLDNRDENAYLQLVPWLLW
jgi:hypothetical protein